MDDRLKVMQALPMRDCCPQCGVFNNCAMKQGKSISACWCVAVSVPIGERIESGAETDSCLCRSCLLKEK